MYKKYSDTELIAVYKTMMNVSGKPSSDMIEEIERRGGMDKFLATLARYESQKEEIARIRKEVEELTGPGTDLEFIRNMVSSKVLSPEELYKLTGTTFYARQESLNNSRITSKTIIGSLTGILIGTCISGVLLFIGTYFEGGFSFVFLLPAYLINYLLIRILTKQTAENAMIFISSLVATILAGAISFFIFVNFRG